MKSLGAIPLRCLLLLLLAGCTTKEPAVVAVDPPPPPKLIHLPGIAGEKRIDHRLVSGLVEAGVAPQAEIFDWTGDRRGLLALGSLAENKQQAHKLASEIEAIYRRDPRTPIILTSHSGGTGIAVWALEMLPKDVHVQSLVMIASALSPGYDLSRALAHVNRAWAFNSDRDEAVLGMGTRLMGTIDRVRSSSAGLVGFNPQRAHDPAQYAKLQQINYDPAWVVLGNEGTHIGAMSTPFAEQVIAPLLLHQPAEPTTGEPAAAPAVVRSPAPRQPVPVP